MKRSRLKPAGPRSRKAAPDLRAFRKAVRDRCRIEEGWFRCQVCGCYTRQIEAHHMQKRRFGNHSPENGLGCCPSCHLWIENHPESAKEQGYSK
jgi:hypothetical protein